MRLVIFKNFKIEGKKYFFAMSHYHARYKSEEISPKVDQEEKEALRAEKEAAEKARIIAEETIEKLQTSVKEEEGAFSDQDQHTQSPRLRKPRRWVQQVLKKVNPVNWPTPVSLRVGYTFPIYHS